LLDVAVFLLGCAVLLLDVCCFVVGICGAFAYFRGSICGNIGLLEETTIPHPSTRNCQILG
jgi:hypothetical protein